MTRAIVAVLCVACCSGCYKTIGIVAPTEGQVLIEYNDPTLDIQWSDRAAMRSPYRLRFHDGDRRRVVDAPALISSTGDDRLHVEVDEQLFVTDRAELRLHSRGRTALVIVLGVVGAVVLATAITVLPDVGVH